MKKFILLFTFLLLPNVVFADNNFLLSCDKNKINVNDQVICRLSFKSDDEYNYIKYDIAELDGLSLIDVRSNYSNLWNVKNNESLSQNVVSLSLSRIKLIPSSFVQKSRFCSVGLVKASITSL